MADTKLTGLTAITSASTDDLLYIVDDPGGTPVSNKITFDNVQKSLTVVGKVTVTQPATGSTLTIVDGKTLTASNNADVSGTNTGDQDLSSYVTLTGTQTLQNKTLDNTNTLNIKDTLFRIEDDGDSARKLAFQLSGLTTTRTLTVQDGNYNIAGTNIAQTFIANQVFSGSFFRLAGAVSGATAFASDASTASGTVSVTPGTYTMVGTSLSQTLTNKTLTAPIIATISNTGTLTLPTSTDTLVGRATTDTLTNKTIGAGTLTLAENASIALDPAGSADGKYTGITVAGTAGAALAFGDLCYLQASDSRWELADADSVTTSGDVMLGMCVLAAAADGDPTIMLLHGIIRADAAFPALTVSAQAYVSTTPGDIQVAQPSGTDDVIRVVGRAITADEIYFHPSEDYVTHT